MSEATYRIGEAAAKLNLKTYVLRFWEMEFPQISPLRTDKGQRLYTAKDLAVLRRIRYLLHERGLTIEGARRILKEETAKGVEYKDSEIALPEDSVEAFADDDGNELLVEGYTNGDALKDSEESYTPSDAMHSRKDNSPLVRGDAIVSPLSVQGSLLPLSAVPAPGLLLTEDIRHLVVELENIRRLLLPNITGEY